MMTATLRREYRFEAAHRLPFVPEGHKCFRTHGHSYRVTVLVRGPIRSDGMLLAVWMLRRLRSLPHLFAVQVSETERSSCIVTVNDLADLTHVDETGFVAVAEVEP